MTPAARLQAAIEILDEVIAGVAAEKALTGWARRSRFAGSKDRAAVRDHVFASLRAMRSFAVLGGGMTGRGLILGMLRAQGTNPDEVFTGEGHAPSPVTDAERADPRPFASVAEERDIPDWLWSSFESSLGPDAPAAAAALQNRAPVHLRVNLGKSDREQAIRMLAQDGIVAIPHPASATALEVQEGARKLRNAKVYTNGLVELQDAASQAVVDLLPLADGMRVLDYCAGGGGKSLAMGARADLHLTAHDIDPRRMKDLPERAARAGLSVTCLSGSALNAAAPFDLVLCDAPCSGSGSWRRAPEGKWRLTRERLDEIRGIQAGILDQAAAMVSPGGVLAYATCSMLDEENQAQVQAFLARTEGWELGVQRGWRVQDGTDGFYVALLTRSKPD
ncbi:RsmB/NOP family class I SAM-dependent RNA methyltransferase [Phycobacter sp. K97]|uniref:RsmB/NOP family class I SAM-dependent RNA methyltransferase n=1 Tax=Phycobacter sedimenti TaxID=3133977 RepID=UPI00311F9570